MPQKTEQNGFRWWAAVLSAGPGWVVLGALKQIGGAFPAFYLISQVSGVGAGKAVEPIEQFVNGFELLFPAGVALLVAVVLVVLSQMKINVTNAYAGSLAWSNFFSRVFHWHPGRVWWVFLNVGIALSLMLFGVFGFLNFVLGFYSNVAIAGIGAVVADLVINKPLSKVSPSYMEFKRAHLYQINPVGFGAMVAGAAVSIPAFSGVFGPFAQAFSPYLALGISFVLSLALGPRPHRLARGGALGGPVHHQANLVLRFVSELCAWRRCVTGAFGLVTARSPALYWDSVRRCFSCRWPEGSRSNWLSSDRPRRAFTPAVIPFSRARSSFWPLPTGP